MKKIIFLFVAIGTTILSSYAQQNCSLKRDENGIKIYTCSQSDSRYNSVRAEYTIYSNLQDYLKVLFDVENYPAWQFKTFDTKLLKSNGENSFTYYAIIDSPWPVTDRDMVLNVQVEYLSKKELKVVIQSKPNQYQEKKGLIRVPKSVSTMYLEQTGPNEIKVKYLVSADPGGTIPAWVVNMFCTEAPYETFSSLKNILEYGSNGEVLISKHKAKKSGL